MIWGGVIYYAPGHGDGASGSIIFAPGCARKLRWLHGKQKLKAPGAAIPADQPGVHELASCFAS